MRGHMSSMIPTALPLLLCFLLLEVPPLTQAVTCQTGLVRSLSQNPLNFLVLDLRPYPPLQVPVFSTLDEYPPPVEPVRIHLGVTVTLTASNFDGPLPAISMPCTDGFLGTSPMECTWIKGTGGGEVRLVGKPLQPTLGNPVTDFLYKFPVIVRLVFLLLSQLSLKLCGGRCRSK
jgi:hypothetical protein